jgi:glycosyltransferase involved in cell wall biosynthesis
MNIGWISGALPHLPCRNGFSTYAANLIQRLSGVHRIDLISLVFPEEREFLSWPQRCCSTVHAIYADRQTVVRRFSNFCSSYLYARALHYRHTVRDLLSWGRDNRGWDLLHVEGGFMAGLIPPDYPLPRLLSLHDSEMLRAEEMLRCTLSFHKRLKYLLQLQCESRYARLVYPRFDRCVLLAERDARFNREFVPEGKFVVISLGIDTEHYSPRLLHSTPAALVFHGNLSYPPNVDAALHLANHIFPLVKRQIPNVTLKLIGAAPHDSVKALASHPAITLAADLPDLREALASGEIYACAVRFGSGLKNKVLEAMAMGLPVVSYRISTSGIKCTPGKHLQVADSPQEFAGHIVELLQHPNIARQMADAARDLVVTEYEWDSKVEQWNSLYQEVIDSRRTNRGIKPTNVRPWAAALYN